MYRAIFAALAAVMLLAQHAAAEPSARQRDLSSRYFKALHLNENFEKSVDAMVDPTIASMSKSLGLPESMQPLMRDLVIDTNRELFPKMFKVMEEAIAETWTEEELLAAVNFYESPIGQSIVAKTPELNAKLTPILAEIMSDQMRTVPARIREKLCPNGQCPTRQPTRNGSTAS